MPTLTIDNRTVTVPDGTNVLEAAQELGIVIPHFCYHEALGAVGSCRLCAMTFVDGPVKGVQMACMVEAKDGMVVSTADEGAVEQRSHVIEWLMTNHPHDCPVCDEGGQCQLQDMTISGGHSIRRYRGPKRAYTNQNLGPFIEQEMNRCIQCYRCLRTYKDYCGGEDFGVMGSRNRIFFGRFRPGRLESPFSGNLADVCPTGVFTDKTFRFKTRYWDLEEAPSVCPHCSLGCAVIPGGRYRELQRVRSGINRKVNGFFICDRGRFGYGHVNHPERPRVPRIKGVETGWDEALATVKARIEGIIASHGPESVALLGSPRASLEANALLEDWGKRLGTSRITLNPHPGRDRAARTFAARVGSRVRDLEAIRNSDLVVLIGADPLAEGPLMALAVRQAVRAGAQAAILDPRPVKLPCAAAHLPLHPDRLIPALGALVQGEMTSFSRREATFLEGLAKQLKHARNPVLIGGADLLGEAGVAALLDAAEHLSEPERPCGASLLMDAPNSYGAALQAGSHPDFDALLGAIEDGEVRALVCLESDPGCDYPDPGRAEAALSRLDFLAVIDALPGHAVRRADVLLPSTTVAEAAGAFVNNEGRMVAFERVLRPGIPIRSTGQGNHPPRTFASATPGSMPRPAWEILAALLRESPSLPLLRGRLEQRDDRFGGLSTLAAESEGIRISGCGGLPPEAPAPFPGCIPERTLPLLAVEAQQGSELLSSLSAALEALCPGPRVLLHPEDAEHLGLSTGDAVHLTVKHGRARATLVVEPGMARGLAIVPRLRHSPLEIFIPGGFPINCALEKEDGHE